MGWVEEEEKLVKKEIIFTEKLVWKYHNVFIILLSITIAIVLLKSTFLKEFISSLGNLGYLGVFISGIFFSYGLTTAPAISMIYLLSKNLNPFYVAIFGMIGAIISDYLIFRFVKYNLTKEVKKLADKVKFHPHLSKSYIKFLKSIAPLIAGIIIASPLPDELAASILGSIKIPDKEFLFISIISNLIGIYIIAIL